MDPQPPTSEKPRFLAPITKPRDYVDRPELAVRHEPECIGPAIVDGYAEVADFQRSQQHVASVLLMQQVRPFLAAEDRLADAQRRAKQSHRKDLSGEFIALRHMIANDRKGGGNPSPSTLERLGRAEARLDGLDQAA